MLIIQLLLLTVSPVKTKDKQIYKLEKNISLVYLKSLLFGLHLEQENIQLFHTPNSASYPEETCLAGSQKKKERRRNPKFNFGGRHFKTCLCDVIPSDSKVAGRKKIATDFATFTRSAKCLAQNNTSQEQLCITQSDSSKAQACRKLF